MAFRIITGHLGAGKTLYAAKLITEAYNYDVVYTNIPVYPHVIRKLAKYHTRYEFVGWQDVVDFSYSTQRFQNDGLKKLLVIDEVHFMVNSRDWIKWGKDEDYKSVLRFFSMSRKLGFDVYFIAQGSNMIDKQLRVMAESIIEVRNLLKFYVFGFLPLWLVLPFLAPFNSYVEFAQWHASEKVVLRRGLYLRRAYYGVYDTYFNYANLLEEDFNKIKFAYSRISNFYYSIYGNKPRKNTLIDKIFDKFKRERPSIWSVIEFYSSTQNRGAERPGAPSHSSQRSTSESNAVEVVEPQYVNPDVSKF